MAFPVEFCPECPFAGECSNDNEVWVATMVAGDRPEGVAVSWQDAEGHETPDVRMHCTPADGKEFSEFEFDDACYQAAIQVDNCEGPTKQRFLFFPIRKCAAFGTMSHEPAVIRTTLRTEDEAAAESDADGTAA